MIKLPAITTPRWTQEQAVAFEAARECLGEVIAICVASIAEEEAKAPPDAEHLDKLEAELTALTEKRRMLQLIDTEDIAEIRSVFGAKVRNHREQGLLATAQGTAA